MKVRLPLTRKNMGNSKNNIVRIMTYQEFIENLHLQAELQAEAQIRNKYVKKPGYKKNDWKRYRKTEEYQSRYQESLTGIQKEFCDKTEDELKAMYEGYCEKQENLIAEIQAEEVLKKEWDIWKKNNESKIISKMDEATEDVKEEAISMIEKDVLSKKQFIPRLVSDELPPAFLTE